MLRIRETEFWKAITFPFRCNNIIKKLEQDLMHADDALQRLRKIYSDEVDDRAQLRAQIEEAKIIYDTMDAKHVKDKEVMALEIESLREKYAKLHADHSFEAANPDARLDVEFKDNGALDIRESVSVLKEDENRHVSIAMPEYNQMKAQEIVNQFPKKNKKKNKR